MLTRKADHHHLEDCRGNKATTPSLFQFFVSMIGIDDWVQVEGVQDESVQLRAALVVDNWGWDAVTQQ